MKLHYVLSIVALTLAACTKTKKSNPPPATTTTPYISISTSSSSVAAGTSLSLTWSTEGINEESCSISATDGSTLPAFSAKSATVTPTTSVTYTATCTTSAAGVSISETNSATVSMSNSAPILTTDGVAIYVNGETSATVESSGTATLSWQTRGVTDESLCTITANPTTVLNLTFANKSGAVNPTVNTTYTITCPNATVGQPSYTASASVNIGTGGSGGNTTPPPLTTCGGQQLGGYCWYLSTVNQSCDSVCSARGATVVNYDSYAGSMGSDTNCSSVLQQLGIVSSDAINSISCTSGWGCYANATGVGKNRCRNPSFVSNIVSPAARIACACSL